MILFQKLIEKFCRSIDSRLRDGVLKSRSLSLQFIQGAKDVREPVSGDLLPVITDYNSTTTESVTFSFDEYSKNLNTKVLGNVLFYAEVIKSTMDVFDRYQDVFC